jgi:hypothetical protein
MMAAPMFIPAPAPLYLERFITLESPFAWKSEIFYASRRINFFPKGMSPTVSFTASRISKALGYIPFVGSIIGGLRIFSGVVEYRHFSLTHLHALSNRSVKWIVRGILETIPFLGGIVCMILDLVATVFSPSQKEPKPFDDETPCGYCHQCGYCRC